MKTKLICWLPESFYLSDFKTGSVDFLIENNIVPLLDSKYSKEIWDIQGRPEWALRYFGYGRETELQPYQDEIISVKKQSQKYISEKIGQTPDLILGETSTETISQLVDAGCKSITYTCYGWHLFRIFGLNIRMPFTTQLNTWRKLEELYGEKCSLSEEDRKLHPDWAYYISSSKFNLAWIMLDQVKSFKKLIGWCIAHNKTIGLVAPDNKQNNPRWVKEHLTEFIKQYKEVVK